MEVAFRAWKTRSWKVHPIHHRWRPRVIGHVFLCLWVDYVEYYLRQRLAPLQLADEDPADQTGAAYERGGAV